MQLKYLCHDILRRKETAYQQFYTTLYLFRAFSRLTLLYIPSNFFAILDSFFATPKVDGKPHIGGLQLMSN